MGKNEARNVRVFEPGKFVSVPSNGKDIKLIVTVTDTIDDPMAGSYEIWGLVGGVHTRLKAVDIKTLGTVNVIENPGVYQIVAAGAFEGIGFGETDNSNETGDVSFVGRFIEGNDDSLAVSAKFAENHKVTISANLSWPWGTNIEYEQLVQDIYNGDAHAEITVDGSAVGLAQNFTYAVRSNSNSAFSHGVLISNTTVSDCLGAEVIWNSTGIVNRAMILMNGEVTDATSIAQLFSTELTIYYHPMTN